MAFKVALPVQTRLLIVALAAMFPVALAAGWALSALLQDEQRSIEAKSLEVTRLGLAAIDVEMQRNIAALKTLTYSQQLVEGDLGPFKSLLIRVLDETPEWGSITLRSSSGQLLIGTESSEPRDLPVIDQASFDTVISTKGPAAGNLVKGHSGQWTSVFRVPVLHGGRVAYVLSARVRPETFLRVLRGQSFPSDWIVSVFDGNGLRIARSKDHEVFLGGPPSPSLQALMKPGEMYGAGITTSMEGTEAYSAFVKLPVSGWSIAIGLPTSEYLLGVRKASIWYGGGLLISVLGGLFAARIAARAITTPIDQLRSAASAIGVGGIPAAQETGIVELTALSSAMFDAARSRAQSAALVEDERRIQEILNRTGIALASHLDLDALLQSVTDAGRALSNAEFGAFFYNTTDESGDAYQLYILSGASWKDFEKLGKPRATPLFAPTFQGGPPIRCADVMEDPRYGQWEPHKGKPHGHLPVRSYLGVPVVSRSGQVIGGLFYGHSSVNMFDERAERLVVGIAAQAAVAIDNARLYETSKQLADERAQLLASERSAREEAMRESASKDEFLAILSHELRTPLSAILGWSHIVRSTNCKDADRDKGLETIERNAQLQAQLIDDLLDMSRIVAGKVGLDPQVVLPYSFVEGAIQSNRPEANKKNVAIEMKIDPAAKPITVDAGRLQQVVSNLVSNAVKFTPSGGKIVVEVKQLEGELSINVSDTGAGIAPEVLPLIFNRFRQADSSITRKYGGLGLGLAICKQLVELHGGKIEAQSAGLGLGALFTIRLPSAALIEPNTNEPAYSTPAEAASSSVDLTGVRVLLVDDEADARELAARLLQEASADVVAMPSALSALDALANQKFDVLISDIGMPDIDGYELLRRLRAAHGIRNESIPAVALTAFARPEDVKKSQSAGFDAHLTKPVAPASLLSTVARLARKPAL